MAEKKHKIRKRQTSLLLSEVTYFRGAALAVIRNEPMAEIWRMVIEGVSLQSLEKRHVADFRRLNFLADRLGIEGGGLVLAEMMLRDKHKIADAWLWEKYPGESPAIEAIPVADAAA